MTGFEATLLAAEVLGTIFGVLSVYLLTVGNGRGWPLGVLWILLTGYVYWNRNVLGSAWLQLFFLLTQLAGWWRWKAGTETDLRVASGWLSQTARWLLLSLFLGAWYGLTQGLGALGGSGAWMDSFCTVGSVLAQSLMVLGRRECWLLWLAVNVVYVFLNASQHLWAFALLYLLFAVLAVKGWREWTRMDREVDE